MVSAEELQQANVNRSIRTIKAELEYLCDAAIITPETLSDLLSRVPPQTALRAPISVGAVPTVATPQPPTSPMNNLNLQNNNNNEKSNMSEQNNNNNSSFPPPSPQPPPPAYNPPQARWPALAQATALYAYTSTDAGDLPLQPNDHIEVTEYMNAEWWKGRSTRTGQEGIFPRSYVRVLEGEKQAPPPMQQPQWAAPQMEQQPQGSGYGNMPLDVSNGAGGKVPGRGAELGKKFGRKLGNAAIFGAGATMGADLVNSIL